MTESTLVGGVVPGVKALSCARSSEKSGTFLPRRGWMLFRSAVNDLTRCLLLAGCLASPGLSGTALAASPSPLSAGRGYGLDGTWVGTYERQHLGPAFVAIRIDESQATPQINVSIRSQRIAGARATRVVAN